MAAGLSLARERAQLFALQRKQSAPGVWRNGGKHCRLWRCLIPSAALPTCCAGGHRVQVPAPGWVRPNELIPLPDPCMALLAGGWQQAVGCLKLCPLALSTLMSPDACTSVPLLSCAQLPVPAPHWRVAAAHLWRVGAEKGDRGGAQVCCAVPAQHASAAAAGRAAAAAGHWPGVPRPAALPSRWAVQRYLPGGCQTQCAVQIWPCRLALLRRAGLTDTEWVDLGGGPGGPLATAWPLPALC